MRMEGFSSNEYSTKTCYTPTKPHFIQPCLHGFTHQLRIPHLFFKNYLLGYKSEHVTLRSSLSHKTWKVKISGLKLRKGWKEFVAAHGVQLGDVVVFRHEGNMVFYVTVFGSTACGREYPQYVCVEEEDSSSDSDEKPETGQSRRPTFEYDQTTFFRANLTDFYRKRDILNVPKGLAKSKGLANRRCDIIIKDREERSWVLNLTHNQFSGQVYIGNGLNDLLRANDIKKTDSFGFEIIQGGDKPILHLISKKSSSKDKGRSSRFKVVSSRASGLECPSFVVRVTAHHLKKGIMPLPIKFVKENGLENGISEIKLMDDHGKIWCAKLNRGDNHKRERYMIGRGWGQFCIQNRVKEGDSLKIGITQHTNDEPLLKISSCH